MQFERDVFKLLTMGVFVIAGVDILVHGSAAVQIVNALSSATAKFYGSLKG